MQPLLLLLLRFLFQQQSINYLKIFNSFNFSIRNCRYCSNSSLSFVDNTIPGELDEAHT